MAARPSVTLTKSHTACTFGAIEPAAKRIAASCAGATVPIARSVARPQSAHSAGMSVSISRQSAPSSRATRLLQASWSTTAATPCRVWLPPSGTG